MRSVYLALYYLSFFVLGAAAPFVLTLGYLWVDTFRPQDVSYAILKAFPIAAVIGAAAVGSYLLLDRRAPPRPNAIMLLTLLFALWVTLTTVFFAVAPDEAWRKWDWAFKTLMFSVFVQFAIRSRIQIEAFLQVYLFSLFANFLPAAMKTLVTGGGYDRTLGLTADMGAITESSTFATVSLMMLPIILYLRSHTRILPRSWITDAFYAGTAVVALIAAVGTFARTGVIGMIVVGAGMWLRSKRKLLLGLVGLAALSAVALLTSDAWNQRISTISDYQNELSAFSRILVWRWTLAFVADNPFGGGFEAYLVNQIALPGEEGEEIIQKARAFHSIYFEMLGEHGWIGLGLFLALAAATLFAQQAVVRRTRHVPELLWCNDLARALQVSLVTLLACGAFVGFGFQPMLYYMFAISAALRQYVARAIRAEPSRGWRTSLAMRPAPAGGEQRWVHPRRIQPQERRPA